MSVATSVSSRNTERQAIERAKALAVSDPSELSRTIASYGITDQRALVEIAKVAAAQDGWGTSRHIQNYGIADEGARIEIAKVAAAHDGGGTSKHIRKYGIADEGARIEIAKVAAAHDGGGTSEYIQNYEIADEGARIEIAKVALTQDLFSMRFLSNYNLSDTVLNSKVLAPFLTELCSGLHADKYFRNLECLFKKVAFYSAPLKELGISEATWETLEPHEKAKVIGDYLNGLYKKHTGRDILVATLLEVQAEEVVFDALAAAITWWDTADVTRYGSRSRATLASCSGYESIPSGELSPNACRELWGVVLSARNTIGPELPSKVPVNFTNKAQALKVLTLATALKGLGGELPIFSEPIDSTERFQAAEAILTERVTAAFKSCLSIGNGGDATAVTRLWERWGGDLTPFVVLAGRYNSHEEWNGELPVLSEVAQKCLEGSFHEWRYRRGDQQLSMLSDEQLAGWRKNPCQISKVTVSAANELTSEAAQVGNLKSIFTTNLLQHVPENVAVSLRTAPLEAAKAEALLLVDERAFSKQSLGEAVKLISYALDSGDVDKIRKAVSLTNGVKGTLLRSVPEDMKRQVSEDLKSLNDSSKKVRVSDGNEYCVVSVITDDPKLLLMTGDLVQAASCQNLRSGSRIQTLPGYVVDGNIKLALTYVVKKGVMDQLGVKDYDSLTFDSSTQTLCAPGAEKQLKLGYAMRREVLRIGASNGEAVCVTERPYLQTHAISEQIANHQRELVAAHIKGSGIRYVRAGEVVTCPASRNPGGVYSDKGGGVMKGKYSLAM